MSIYDPSYLGEADNQIAFNVDNGPTATYYRVETRAPQGRQLEESDLPLPFESGISDWRTLVGKTIYVITGTAYPPDEDGSDLALRALRKVASLDFEQADPNSDFGYVPYVWGEVGNTQLQLFLKPLYVKVLESARRGIVQPFEIICKVKDPTIYGVTLNTASTQGVNPVVSGGTAIYPFAYPIIYGSSTFSVNSVLTNNGDIATYPQAITIHGPINNPKLTNSRTGEYLRVLVNMTSASDVLQIVYGKSTISVELNGVSVIGSVDTNSTYFKIQPGANPLLLSGDSVGSGAYFVATCYDAYPLS